MFYLFVICLSILSETFNKDYIIISIIINNDIIIIIIIIIIFITSWSGAWETPLQRQ